MVLCLLLPHSCYSRHSFAESPRELKKPQLLLLTSDGTKNFARVPDILRVCFSYGHAETGYYNDDDNDKDV